MSYAEKAVAHRRWNVFEWMIDRAGPMEGINDADETACVVAAADGDVARLEAFRQRGYGVHAASVAKQAGRYRRLGVLEWLESHEHHKEWKSEAIEGAIKGNHDDIIEWTIERRGTVKMLTKAAKYGRIDLLEKVPMDKDRGHPGPSYWAHEAARSGQIGVLIWLAANGYSWDADDVCTEGAAMGHLAVIEWAAARGPGCLRGASALMGAAQGRHMHVLEWLWANGHHDIDRLGCAAEAAIGGHLHVVEWLIARGCDMGVETCDLVARLGHVATLEWCISRGFAWAFGQVVNSLVRFGRMDVVEWETARRKRMMNENEWVGNDAAEVAVMARSITIDALKGACRNGYLEVLQWLDHHSLIDMNGRGAGMFLSATEGGRLDVLAWLQSKGCAYSGRRCMAKAASRGDIDTLLWLSLHGCTYDERTVGEAIAGECYGTAEWLRARGAPWDKRVCAWLAGKREHCSILLVGLEWARSRGCPWGASTTERATSKGLWDVLEWAIGKGCPWNKRVEQVLGVQGINRVVDAGVLLDAIDSKKRQQQEEMRLSRATANPRKVVFP